jgi:integrase
MANIRTFRQKTKDGKEITRYMLDYVDRSGNRRRHLLPKGNSRKDAWLEKQSVETFKERPKRNRFNPIMTLEEALYTYLSFKRSGTEHIGLIEQIKRQLLEVFGNIKMIEFTLLDGARFLQHLQAKKNLAPSSIRTYAYYAKLFFEWARLTRLIDFNIFDNVKLPSRQPSTEFLTEEELESVYDDIMEISNPEKQLELRCLFLLLTQLGCRISEVLNTPLKNYSFKSNIIRLAPAKGKQRITLVTPDTMKLLFQLEAQNADREVMFRHRSRWYGEQFKIIYQKLGIQYGKKPLHLLRHTFCTLAIEQGANLEDVSKYVGHSDSRVTGLNYVHVVPVVDSTASRFAHDLTTSLLSRSANSETSHVS